MVRAQLEQRFDSLPPSKYRSIKALLSPYSRMDHKVAVLAWGWIDEMDALDGSRIEAFYRAHVDRGPEDVP